MLTGNFVIQLYLRRSRSLAKRGLDFVHFLLDQLKTGGGKEPCELLYAFLVLATGVLTIPLWIFFAPHHLQKERESKASALKKS
jgi:hypothetical protein